MSDSCRLLKYSRSAFYKARVLTRKRKHVDKVVLDKVLAIKQVMPNIGGRKIYGLLRKTLLRSGHTELGRDRLFELLKQHDLLVNRKRKYAVTTDSNHPFKRYPNLIKDKEISRVNQLWVSDITYLKVSHGFCFLSLITDVRSRKIVGYYVNDTLELTGTVKALNRALEKDTPEIHHSDRGSQYCSYAYTDRLKSKGVKISMTENGNCYENAIAERVNGILKSEFNLNANFKNLKQARKAVKQAVNTYNELRPHWSINLKTPNEVYLKTA